MKWVRVFTIILFSSISFLIASCNHLLYPASREQFVDKKFLMPIPDDVFIDVSSTEKLHAWLFRTTAKEKKGVVLHFHGNGQNLSTHFGFFSWMSQFGFDYLIFDYRGYGQSSSNETSQESTVQDGLAALRYVKSTYPKTPLIMIGQSLGSNIMARVLQETTKEHYPNLAVFDSSFLSYQGAARSVLKQRWFFYPLVPLTYVALSDQWSAQATVDKNPSDLPALYFHGTSDTVIAAELGHEHFESWKGPKVFVELSGGGHTSAFSDPAFAMKSREQLLNCFDFVVNKESKDFKSCGDLKH